MKRDIELEATLQPSRSMRRSVPRVGRAQSPPVGGDAESLAIGYGGDAVVSSATVRVARETIRKTARREIARDEAPDGPHSTPYRRRTAPHPAGRQPGIQAALQALVDPLTRGDRRPRRCAGRARVARSWRRPLTDAGVAGEFDHCAAGCLHRLGYRRNRARSKRQEGTSLHPDRVRAVRAPRPTRPRTSIWPPASRWSRSTRRRSRAGRELQERRAGRPSLATSPTPAAEGHAAARCWCMISRPTPSPLGKAIPYGVYATWRAHDSLGSRGLDFPDHDSTGVRGGVMLDTGGHQIGCDLAYPEATTLSITADAASGGSNVGIGCAPWKHELQQRWPTTTGADHRKVVIFHPAPASGTRSGEHGRSIFCHITGELALDHRSARPVTSYGDHRRQHPANDPSVRTALPPGSADRPGRTGRRLSIRRALR